MYYLEMYACWNPPVFDLDWGAFLDVDDHYPNICQQKYCLVVLYMTRPHSMMLFMLTSVWDTSGSRHLPAPTGKAYRECLLVAISCLFRDTVVRCLVVGPFLWLARRPGTSYQTIFEIRHVLWTFFVVTWKLFSSRSTSVHSTSGALRLCAIYKSTIDIDIDNVLPML